MSPCATTLRHILLLAVTATAVLTTAARADEQTLYGAPLSEVQHIRVGELAAHPEQYVDERIKVVGLVDDVCPAKGCWVDIIDAQSTETIRFKVEDDVIVFPVEARGNEIVAEGILRKHQLSKSQALARMRHLAEERGEPFDESTVTGPMSFYQIEGLGAAIGSGA